MECDQRFAMAKIVNKIIIDLCAIYRFALPFCFFIFAFVNSNFRDKKVKMHRTM